MRQKDYEAEVKVYRALEKLNEPILVLHGLKYNRYQFTMWDAKPNCKKSERNKDEGEHDFVVIGPDYIVIIEVKNPSTSETSPFFPSSAKKSKKDPIGTSIEKSRAQFEKAIKLVQGIAETFNPESQASIKLFQIVAFPNLNKAALSSVISSSGVSTSNGNSSEQNSLGATILTTADHLEDFSSFWNDKIKCKSSSKIQVCGDIIKIQHVLLRLFVATGKDGKEIDKCKICLTECVKEIDRKLRDSEITFATSKRPPNPKVVSTSDIHLVGGVNIFRDCLGLKYITKEQLQAYNHPIEHLIITGPAGSGKTLVLLARVMRLALIEPTAKIELIVMNDMKLVKYADIFRKAHLKVIEWQEDYLDSNDTDDILKNCQVLITHQKQKYLRLRDQFKYRFVDDFQFVDGKEDINHLLSTLKINNMSVDFNQNYLSAEQNLLESVSSPQLDNSSTLVASISVIYLTGTYRNSRNIVSQLMTLSWFLGQDDDKTPPEEITTK